MAVDKKQHIISHAMQLFADKGFEATSIRDLAKVADVNVAMVNYYFGSKDKLMEAIIEEKAAYMKDRIEELNANKDISEIDKVNALIEDYVDRIIKNPNFHKLLHKELMGSNRENLHQLLTNTLARNTKNFAKIIETGIKKKVFKKVDATLTVASIIGSITQVMMSKNMCNQLIDKPEDYEPYTDEAFKKRLVTHIKQMMQSHLLINQ
ncbi:MAG: TetR/AcrR family transcriptional regulator [Pedobacter sp.]|nr:TetR/AcrR family transcriptional regulator [Chitinophagaceae bacterium]